MPVYTFGATITVSAITTVEADTYEEALKEAESREPVNIVTTGEDEYDGWVTDELDGTPMNIRFEAEE